MNTQPPGITDFPYATWRPTPGILHYENVQIQLSASTGPFVLKKGSTLADFAGKVHQDFARNLTAARVWGNAVYDGQMVQRDHRLQDGDVVELHL